VYNDIVASTSFNNAGHIFTANQTVATTSVASCGTLPSVVGNDTAGIITTGSGSPSACTLVYSQAWDHAPVCTLADSLTSITPDISADNTTSTVFSFSGALNSGKIYYHCLGY
jgi:hypothetical protein